jgi:hypothetical protein
MFREAAFAPSPDIISTELFTQKPRENGFWVMGSSREWFRTALYRQSGLTVRDVKRD